MVQSRKASTIATYTALMALVVGIATAGVRLNSDSHAKSNLEKKVTASSINVENSFVVSEGGSRYHIPSCKYMKTILAENIETFPSIEHINHSKYSPCGVCLPSERHARRY
jgi:methylphosphotriester-DNA--protein-cysteine methyltransferase